MPTRIRPIIVTVTRERGDGRSRPQTHVQDNLRYTLMHVNTSKDSVKRRLNNETLTYSPGFSYGEKSPKFRWK